MTAGIDTVKVIAYEFERPAGGPRPSSLSTLSDKRSGLVIESSRWKLGPGNVGFDTPPPTVLKSCLERRNRFGLIGGGRSDGSTVGHMTDCGCFGRVWYEVSVPKVFYGDGSPDTGNLRLVPPEVLFEFASIASEAALAAAGIEVQPKAWKIGRLDVAADFSGDTLEGRAMIDAIARLKFVKMTAANYAHGGTAEHRSRSRKFKVYDKATEAGLAHPPRKRGGKMFPAGPLRAFELVRFESGRRFEKAERWPCWNLNRPTAGGILYQPIAAALRTRQSIDVASPVAWIAELATTGRDVWDYGRYPNARLLRLAGIATLLAAVGRDTLLSELGLNAGYRALRDLRDAGYSVPDGDTTTATTAPRVVQLEPVVQQIAAAFAIKHQTMGQAA